MSGFDPHSGRCVVSLSKVHLPSKVLVIPRLLWLHPDMTEILFPGTLSKRKKNVSQNWPGHPGSVLPFFLHFFSEYWENIPHKILFWVARHK